ncbi:MAG: hypothetical protein ABIO40_10070 [Devosia sp.]
MSAARRLATLDELPAIDLIAFAEGTLAALVGVMNSETTMLRAGRFREAATLGADKTQLAQDYVTYSRAVQRQMDRLKREAPGEIGRLRNGHEKLATQMAENLKVIATARAVTEDLLTDVAGAVARSAQTRTYGANGEIPKGPAVSGKGIAINRAL